MLLPSPAENRPRLYLDQELFLAAPTACHLLKQFTQTQTGALPWNEGFCRSGPSECDFVLCPALWRGPQETEIVWQARHLAQHFGKPLLVFCETDSEAPFPVPDVFVFRGSLRKSLRLAHEFPTPAFFEDRLTPSPQVLRPLRTAPVVGFCGNIDSTAFLRFRPKAILRKTVYWGLLSRPALERVLRRTGLRITRSEGKRVRYQALGVVRRCPDLQANFVIRDHFANGTLQLPQDQQAEHLKKALKEFCANVINSDYTLCPRGAGNWSYRFYETLCLGRIPVFIDTDCLLPYESVIPWRKYCVWVDGNHIEDLPGAILEHYRSHTPESFAELQQKCRNLWVEYLSVDGFFHHFYRHFPKMYL